MWVYTSLPIYLWFQKRISCLSLSGQWSLQRLRKDSGRMVKNGFVMSCSDPRLCVFRYVVGFSVKLFCPCCLQGLHSQTHSSSDAQKSPEDEITEAKAEERCVCFFFFVILIHCCKRNAEALMVSSLNIRLSIEGAARTYSKSIF